MLRGFSREVLAIASWAAAAAAAYYFYPVVVPYLTPYIHKDIVAEALAAAIVFFATLIVVSLVTVRLSDAILDSKIGALDRTLGFVFGIARGFALAVVGFAIYSWLVAEKQQPQWVQSAKTKWALEGSAEWVKNQLPDNAVAAIDTWIKSHGNVLPASDEPVDESAAPTVTKPAATPAPGAAGPKKVDSSTDSKGQDKQKLDALINRNVPKPAPAAPAAIPKQ